MKILLAFLLLGFAFGRPQGNYEEDSSLNQPADNEEIQNSRHLSPARRYSLIDYGGNTFPQQWGRVMQSATPLRADQSESVDDAEVQSYRENYDELRGKSVNRDTKHVNRVASNKDHKSSNARNSRQDPFIRDARVKAKLSPSSTGVQKRTTPTSEGGQRITYDVASKLNDDNNANQRTLSEETDDVNYAADYEPEEGSQTDSRTNEERVQKQTNTVDNNSEPAEYDDGNLGNEELRERRDTSSRIMKADVDQSKPEQPTTQDTNSGEYGESVEGKEELAIKRHIANLSANQMNDLLTSLPTDKRVLLQEIIDSDKVETKKREVRKSDGTARIQSEGEPENIIVNAQSASVKQPDSPVTQLSQSTESDILNKASDAIINIKEISSKNEAEKKINEPISAVVENNKIGNNDVKISDVGLEEGAQTEGYAKVDVQRNVRSEAAIEKTNNKREIKLNDYNSPIEETEDSSDINADSRDDTNDEDYSAVKEEPSNSETLKSKSEIQPIKREILEDELLNQHAGKSDLLHKDELSIAEQIEALEASFPNIRSYDDTNNDKLVRVKRNKRDLQRKKRAASLLDHEANNPYRADTEDEDDDEGNEFEDDGFYDRTSNLGGERKVINKVASGKESLRKRIDSEANKAIVSENQSKLVPIAAENSVSQDISGIGSDSDNVLSGSDGADENLMLTSGGRSRLTRDSDNDLNYLGEVSDSSPMDDKKLATEELHSVQNDQNGAFGGLPKNYDGELSRFKRIRRQK